MAELPDLVAALWSRVCEIPAIRRVEDAIDGIDADGAQWCLRYGAGAELTVDWVLAADGARSAVRELTGQHAGTRATGHSALATVARTEQGHDNIARQRFLVDGPLALLPTREPQVISVVWSQPPDAAQARLALPDDAFCQALEVASEGVLGAVQAVGVRGAFPIVELMAADFAPAPGLAFVGDAAHVVHPLAGLGVNLGLEDVIALRPVLSSALAQDGPGERAGWRSWRRQRRARSVLVQRSLTGLQRFFAADAPLASWVRNVGVRAVNRAGPIRRAIIREAMGL
jgi:2-octaprenylphenol hydroxylase